MPEQIEIGYLNRLAALNNFDYTKLDFRSIKSAIIAFIQQNYPDAQNDFYQSSAAVMLIDILSYINDILAFRADFLANEAYLPTASTQKAIIDLLALINYTPAGPSAAVGEASVTLLNIDTSIINSLGGGLSSSVVISDPRSAPLSIQTEDIAGNTINFELFKTVNDQVSQVLMPKDSKIGKTITAVLSEGKFQSETFTLPATVPANYMLTLSRVNILEDSMTVAVDGQEYTKTENFAFENGATYTYQLKYEQTNSYSIMFGDGIFGINPPSNAVVNVRYRTGGGILGNLSLGSIDRTISVNGATVRIQNSSATTGGKNRESLDFSRFYAPRKFSTQYRAVTGADYTILGLGYQDGTNGSVSKCITTLRPYLSCYASSSGPFYITDSNNILLVKTKTHQHEIQMNTVAGEGYYFTLQEVIDDLNAKIATKYDLTEDIEFSAFSYPGYSYRIPGTVQFDADDTITIDDTNRLFIINFNGVPYNVTLPKGELTLQQLSNGINAKVLGINVGENLNFAKFISQVKLDTVTNKYYLEIHLTTDFIPTSTNLFKLNTTGSNLYTTLGLEYAVSNINPSTVYEVSKLAIGLKQHTPDSYLELLNIANGAYTTLGLRKTENNNGVGRALPMAANYVDMYVLSNGVGGIPTQASTTLKRAIRNFIYRYKVLTDKVTIWDGLIRSVDLTVSIKVNPAYVLADVVTNAEAALTDLLGGTNNNFGETFYISKIYESLENIAGIDSIDISDLKENGVSQLTTGSKIFRNVVVAYNEMYLSEETPTVNADYSQSN